MSLLLYPTAQIDPCHSFLEEELTHKLFLAIVNFSTPMENTVLRAKLIVLGDASVGKSSLVQVFHSDSQQGFPKAYSMTTGDA